MADDQNTSCWSWRKDTMGTIEINIKIDLPTGKRVENDWDKMTWKEMIYEKVKKVKSWFGKYTECTSN